MKFNKIPATTFEQLQLGAGIIVKKFTPATGSVEIADIVGATTGGVTFTATPTFSDYGSDIDNCPTNMKELKRLDEWAATMTGTYITASTVAAKGLIAAADIDTDDETHIIPRNDLKDTDFTDLWWVGDYSDKTGATNGGFMAIHLKNALSTGGFSVKTANKSKGQYAFTYTAHYSMENQDEVPFEVYIKSGTDEAA